MWTMHDGMGWWMVFGGVWAILFWVALIALIVWVIRRIADRGHGDPRGPRDMTLSRSPRCATREARSPRSSSIRSRET